MDVLGGTGPVNGGAMARHKRLPGKRGIPGTRRPARRLLLRWTIRYTWRFTGKNMDGGLSSCRMNDLGDPFWTF
jgi:hypothetical protein